jgi:hypothetical protein
MDTPQLDDSLVAQPFQDAHLTVQALQVTLRVVQET